MADTMRASVLTAPSTIEMQERPVPTPGPDEVLVQVGSVGVCGSDVHYYKHGRIADMVVEGPLVLGHEVGGTDRRRRRGRARRPRRAAGRARAAAAVPPLPAVQDRPPEPLPGHGVLRDPAVSTARSATTSRVPADFAHPVPDSLSDAAVGLLEPLSVGHLGQPQGRYDRRVAGSSSPAADRSARWPAWPRAPWAPPRSSSPTPSSHGAGGSPSSPAPAPSTRRDAGFDPATVEADIFLECSGPTLALLDGIKAVRPGGTIVLVGNGEDEVTLPIRQIQNREVVLTGIFRYVDTWPRAIGARGRQAGRPRRAGHRDLPARGGRGRAHQRRRPDEHEVRRRRERPAVSGPFGLDGRTALVTGANRGLGRAFAQALAEAGADVVVVGRHEDRNQQAATEIAESTGRRTTVVTGDVTQADDVRRIVADGRRGPRRHRRRSSTTPASATTGPRSRSPTRSSTRSSTSTSPGSGRCAGPSRRHMIERRRRLHRQRRLDLRRDREPAAVAAVVQRVEGGGAPADQVAGRRVGAVRHPGQRDRARLRQDRDGPGRRAAVPPAVDRGRPDAALRDAGGDRADRGLPGQRRVVVHDRVGARTTAATPSTSGAGRARAGTRLRNARGPGPPARTPASGTTRPPRSRHL